MNEVLEQAEETTTSSDESMTEVIKSLTPQQADALWSTLIQLNPRLADL